MCSCGPPHMANQKQDDQLEHSYSSYVMIRDVTMKTCRRRWMIERRGERGPEISVLVAGPDDDDDDDTKPNWSHHVPCSITKKSFVNIYIWGYVCILISVCLGIILPFCLTHFLSLPLSLYIYIYAYLCVRV